jgi:Zn-dependent protease with chaperone function
MQYWRMLRAFVLVLAFNAQSVTTTPPLRSSPPPVDEAVLVTVPPATPTALRYYTSGNRLWVLDQAVPMALFAIILFSGTSAKLRNLARRIGRNWFFTTIVYVTLFTILTFVVMLPLAYYEEFVRQHAYGLSNQTPRKWVTDSLISLAVTCIAAGLFVWIPYLLLRKSPRRWWLYTAAAAIPFIVVANLIAPVWIAPLFNRFGPMRDKALETRILALADRAGIENSRVFEVNKSVDTKTLNAYVAGLWQTKRIVLWDTTIARLDDRELLFVMGHEMGHYVLGHIWQLVALNSLMILLFLYAAYKTTGAIVARWAHRLGFSDMADVASLPLLLLVVGVLSQMIAPVPLAFARHIEHEADRFGLEITQTNHSAGTAFVKLQQEALGNPWPGPLFKLWRADHPPLGERIEFSNAYHPWREGQPLRYGALLRK